MTPLEKNEDGQYILTPEFLYAWVDALRSGKYEKGTQALCRGSMDHKRYCCLGVAADIIDPTGWEAPAEDGIHDEFQWEKRAAYLTNVAGHPVVTGLPAGFQSALATINDQSATFDTVIKAIVARYNLEWDENGNPIMEVVEL